MSDVVVQVWGEGALFTRPEHKAERVTYPVMTPTAAVGVLEAIFWKPEFEWRVTKIEVLRPIEYFTQRRNESTAVPSTSQALSGSRVDTDATRIQRRAVCLRDVAYRVYGRVVLRPKAAKSPRAYAEQFDRRVRRGACFHQPYLGTREFTGHFSVPDDTPRFASGPLPLGLMLHSIVHPDGGGAPESRWFPARLDDGVLLVPAHGVTGAEALG